MLRRTLRLPKETIAIKTALVIFLVVFFSSIAEAKDVNLNVEVKQAPSATINDFDFSSINSSPASSGRVLGATSTRERSSFKMIYLLLLINPLLFI